MRVKELCIIALLVTALVAGIASFSMPSLLGKPLMPTMSAPAATTNTTQAPAQQGTAGQVMPAAGETFTVTVSGNVYYDKIPVSGAVVTVYHNGRQVGQTTAGDLYQFSVPGAKIGDTIRVDASYEGATGTATEQVKLRTVSLNVKIKSGKSFIRNALEMMTQDSKNGQNGQSAGTSNPQQTITQEDQQQAAQQLAALQGASKNPSQSIGGLTSSQADANKLASQVMGGTGQQLGGMMGNAQNALTSQPSTSALGTADANSAMKVTNLEDAMKIAGVSGLPI